MKKPTFITAHPTPTPAKSFHTLPGKIYVIGYVPSYPATFSAQKNWIRQVYTYLFGRCGAAYVVVVFDDGSEETFTHNTPSMIKRMNKRYVDVFNQNHPKP